MKSYFPEIVVSNDKNYKRGNFFCITKDKAHCYENLEMKILESNINEYIFVSIATVLDSDSVKKN